MCGVAAMFDAVAGKILVAGGSVDYSGSAAVANSYVITIGNVGAQAQVQKTPNMAFKRIYHNAIVLPNGQVFVAGGQDVGSPFNDDSSIMYGELFTPSSGGGTWATMAAYTVPRNYHSVGLLLTDGTVMIGGGGLCNGCEYNHYDGQIWRPPYLFTSTGGVATRPVINSVSSATVRIGQTITVNMNSAVTSFALIRMGSATHTVNTDQRRIPLTPSGSGNTYTVTVPNDAGIALPGYWMLFAMNSAGVPSVSRIIKITL
jgi:galactose oxidase